MNPRKSQMAIIFFTVFLYLVGFGVIIPIIPVLARDLGAGGFEVGLLLSVYSFMQFVFAPFWGRLSDRYGRRPILLFCLVGECFSYIGFGLSHSLEGLFIARVFAGFFGASISTASAYISDITPPNERSKGMALIGVAFGLGFLVGPAMGGALALWGGTISAAPHFGTSFASYCVAGLCLLNFFFGLKFLKESLDPANRNSSGKKSADRFQKLFRYLKMPIVGSLIFVFFLSSIAMSTMEATLVLLVGDRFQWGVREVSFGFAYIGFIMILSQGFLVRRLLPKVGEKKLMVFGLGCMAIGLSSIAFSNTIWLLAVAQTILAVGFSCTNPSILGSISLLSSSKEQGEALGTTQGTASLGRIIGPALGGWLYQNVTKGSPFLTGGGFAVLALVLILSAFAKLPDSAKA
jgi:MFS transporter, DHA1 family, tetracycline resistance protein